VKEATADVIDNAKRIKLKTMRVEIPRRAIEVVPGSVFEIRKIKMGQKEAGHDRSCPRYFSTTKRRGINSGYERLDKKTESLDLNRLHVQETSCFPVLLHILLELLRILKITITTRRVISATRLPFLHQVD
jgi:hypothetical protein